MERLVDKLVALVACLPALAAAVGVVDRGVVAALLVAVISAAAGEVARGRWRMVVPAALCALALAEPPMATLVGVAGYDLARLSEKRAGLRRALPLVLACAPALQCATGRLGVVAAALSVGSLVVTSRLGASAARVEAERFRGRLVRDELRAAELELARRNRDLVDAQDYEVRLARLSERARIAREIHDNVGHLLTRAVMQAEALRVVHARDGAAADFASVAGTVREALAEVRSSVHDLRDESCDLSVRVREETQGACAGTRLSASCRVEAGEAPAEVTACVLAVVREAISNTLRHSDAREAHVELVEHPAFWRLSVTDDGTTAPVPEERAGEGRGMGLVSMEERVRALGGTFRAGPGQRGGWIVFASIPKGDA